VLADHDFSHDGEVFAAPTRDSRALPIAGLRVAFWEDNGFFSPAPAVGRGVRFAVRALQDAGAVVESIPPPKIAEAMFLFTAAMSADAGADMERHLRGSRVDRRLAQLLLAGRVPGFLRPLVAWAVAKSGAQHRAGLVRAVSHRSADEYWQLTHKITLVRRKFLDNFAARFDALIVPPYALPAPRHDQAVDLIAAAGDTMFVSLLGIPSGVVPVTRVRAGEESARQSSRELTVRTGLRAEQESAGLPIGVQVAANFWREDVVLAVMRAIEAAARRAADFPVTPVTP
jgi:fatty acid amide hydrolase